MSKRVGGGFTLLETMIAMFVMLVGAMGLMALYKTGMQMNGNAQRITRATTIAQDLLANLEMLPYDEGGAAFTNATTANDADLFDGTSEFETDADPVGSGLADHGEDDVKKLAGAGSWYGIPTDALGLYQRFWSVAYQDNNGDGISDAVQIAVVVRWPYQGDWRRVVVVGTKRNPNAE